MLQTSALIFNILIKHTWLQYPWKFVGWAKKAVPSGHSRPLYTNHKHASITVWRPKLQWFPCPERAKMITMNPVILSLSTLSHLSALVISSSPICLELTTLFLKFFWTSSLYLFVNTISLKSTGDHTNGGSQAKYQRKTNERKWREMEAETPKMNVQ